MATHHPGEVTHGLESGVGGPPEPALEVLLRPAGTAIFPEVAEQLLEKVGTIDLEVEPFELAEAVAGGGEGRDGAQQLLAPIRGPLLGLPQLFARVCRGLLRLLGGRARLGERLLGCFCQIPVEQLPLMFDAPQTVFTPKSRRTIRRVSKTNPRVNFACSN